MSIEAMTIALHHSRATGTAKLVLVGIANHDGDGGAWPSVATLAKYAGVEKRQINKILVHLEALGEIHRHIQEGGLRGTADYERPNLYDFLLECPSTCKGDKNHTPVDDRRRKVEAVDKSEADPLSSRTPPVPQDRGTPVLQDSPPPVLQDSRTVLGNRPMNLGGALEVVSPADPVDNFAPLGPLPRPERCVDHQHDVSPPPCGACKDARLTLELVEADVARTPLRRCDHNHVASTCPYCPGGKLAHLEGAG